MDEKTKLLQEERNKIFKDLSNNIVPKRMPTGFQMGWRLLAEYAGKSVIDVQYRFDELNDAAFEVAGRLYSDQNILGPVGLISRPPTFYQLLGSQSFQMGNNGFVQHPEVVGMMENEYPQLLEDPYAFLVDVVIPRQYKNMDASNPAKMMMRYNMAKASLSDEGMRSFQLPMMLSDAFGYYNGQPMGSFGFSEAPYDFVADQLRSFSGISADIRRKKNELKDACEAVLPLVFYWGLPANPDPEGSVMTPLHMPTFMREKDFAEVWLPSYLKMIQMYAALGARTCPFCEDDWMRYLDYIQEWPAGTKLMFEYGDPKTIKDKLGDKMMIHGLFPINLLKTGTKQEVLDKAKELLDIMLPGCGYTFGFDKNPLTLGDLNFDNYCALAEFVRDYAVYDNPGESYGQPLNSEGYVFSEEVVPPIKSKYLFDFDEYKKEYPLVPDYTKATLERYDREYLNMVMTMLV